MSLTRTTRFEVVFTDLRKADRLVTYKRVWGLMNDITRTANKLITLLYQVKIGLIKHPERSPRRGPRKGGLPEKIPFDSLAYEACKANGEWKPGGFPAYEPYKDNWRACAGVLAALGRGVVNVRLKEDFLKIRRGEVSLATFRTLPIPYRSNEVRLRDDGSIELATFAREHRNTTIKVRPKKLDASRRVILDRLREGVYKKGSAQLQWKKPSGGKGKWLLSVSWTDLNHRVGAVEAPLCSELKPLVAGVDLGIQHAIWTAFTDLTGSPQPRPEVIGFPKRLLRAVARLEVEKRERSHFNRAPLGLREGRGYRRKMRVTAPIRDKVSRMNDTMLRQLVAQAISKYKQRGVTLISLEDHSHWSVDKMHETARHAGSRGKATEIRKSYFRWHQGAMRQLFQEAAEREGIATILVDAAWTSRDCHACGLRHKRDWIKRPPTDGEVPFGRIEYRKFKCSCGYEGHADNNAAINIARRGIERQHDPTKWALDEKGNSPLVGVRKKKIGTN